MFLSRLSPLLLAALSGLPNAQGRAGSDEAVAITDVRDLLGLEHAVDSFCADIETPSSDALSYLPPNEMAMG